MSDNYTTPPRIFGDLLSSDDADPSLIEFDEESGSSWIMCDVCGKWRKLPENVNMNSLPTKWSCFENKWDAKNDCRVPEEVVEENDSNGNSISDWHYGETLELSIGTFLDIYCELNNVYYVVQIKKRRKNRKSDKDQIRIHYQGNRVSNLYNLTVNNRNSI